MSAVAAQQAPEQQGVQKDVCAFSPEALMLLTPDQVSRAALAHVVAHIHNWHQAGSSALQHAQALHTHADAGPHIAQGYGIDNSQTPMARWHAACDLTCACSGTNLVTVKGPGVCAALHNA